MKNKKNSQNSMTQSQALLALLTAQGLLGDDSIPDEERRKAQQESHCKYPHVEGQEAYEQPGDEGEELRDSVEPVDPAVAGEVLDVELELFAGDPA